jgi:heme exporter protein D
MNGDVAFFVWGAYVTGGLLCLAELAALALRYRNIRQHLGWQRR